MTTSPTAKERAQETAATAADEGRHVAGVAREEAQHVASEAAAQARSLVGEATRQLSDQVGDQSRTQKTRLAETLQSLSGDLESMAGQANEGMAGDLVREAADRTRALGHHLESREPAQLLDDVRDFARRRPGTFLLGALAAGVVAGRLARGARDGAVGAAAAAPAEGALPRPPAPRAGTTNPPMPPVTPGQQTMDPPRAGSALDADGPIGTDAAGYGERGSYGEGTR
ncbi:hypothetical protein [Nocardioides ferulae]|uniref:hypothetical protein n=1 Tax=Nocardioides ferulae TaxID=2340821 RepID=UPI000F88AC91|nr:hypothetical protein [Nocardioides ferulae]